MWFGSCEDRRLTQRRSSAIIPAWSGREKRQIKPVELNWVKRRTSHELNSCKLVELSSAHVKYGV